AALDTSHPLLPLQQHTTRRRDAYQPSPHSERSPFFFYRYLHHRALHSFPTRRSSDLDLVHQQTQNQRYGSSHIGATAKDISNVVTDAASGVVDIFHGIDKAVADTWNNFWKDGKADGIGSNLSRK